MLFELLINFILVLATKRSHQESCLGFVDDLVSTKKKRSLDAIIETLQESNANTMQLSDYSADDDLSCQKEPVDFLEANRFSEGILSCSTPKENNSQTLPIEFFADFDEIEIETGQILLENAAEKQKTLKTTNNQGLQEKNFLNK